MTYSMKEVCEKTGLSAYALRFYEKEGLLPSIGRSAGGVRQYSESDLETLGLVCCLKHTGMPLKEIARFIALTQQGEHTLRDRCDMLRAHQTLVAERIAQMQKHLEKVNCKLSFFTGKLEEYEARSGRSD